MKNKIYPQVTTPGVRLLGTIQWGTSFFFFSFLQAFELYGSWGIGKEGRVSEGQASARNKKGCVQ